MNSNYKVSSQSLFSNGVFTDLNVAIAEISNQLLLNISSSQQKNNKFAITTFVNLNDFKQTSRFARVVSESLIDELHTKHFKLLDYRTQDVISVDNNGEFSLTRDTLKLKDEIPNALIVVGTYSIIDKKTIVVNGRIIDNFTSKVLSTAKVLYQYDNCKILEICTDKNQQINNISISEDN
jgi:TolB-like protein